MAGRWTMMPDETPNLRLVLAANRNLVGFASGRLMLVDHEVNQSGVVFAYFVHLDMIGWARDRERAGE